MKRFSILLFALILFNLSQIIAQDKPTALIKGESATVSENLVKVETVFPNLLGLSYEKKISQHISIYSMLGFVYYGKGANTSITIYGSNDYYAITPQITVQPRFYHNLGKRAALDKSTDYNSANYVGFTTRFFHQSFFLSNSDRIPRGPAVLDLMLSYGLQRSFFKRMNFDVAIQPGIEISQGQAKFFIGLNLQLGFIVFSN
ncbi:MAG: hypothetical protein ACQETL_05415 [Bacteroidota bacterium]